MQRLHIARIGQLIKAYDPVLRAMLEHIIDKIRSYEAGPAGNHYIHVFTPFVS